MGSGIYDHTSSQIHGHWKTRIVSSMFYTKCTVGLLKIRIKHEPSSILDVKSLHLSLVFVETEDRSVPFSLERILVFEEITRNVCKIRIFKFCVSVVRSQIFFTSGIGFSSGRFLEPFQVIVSLVSTEMISGDDLELDLVLDSGVSQCKGGLNTVGFLILSSVLIM